MNIGTKQVACRAWGWLSIIVFIGICLAAMLAIPPDKPRSAEDVRVAGGIMIGLLSLCALGAIWAWRAQVVADERSLRWRRGLGGWQAAYWDEVTDFYITAGRKKSEATRVIEIGTSNIRIDGMWNCPKAFQEKVVERACRARARSWEMQGTRVEDDWPRTFRYDTKDNRRTPAIVGICLVFLLGLPIVMFLPKLIRTYGTPEWVWNLAGAGLFSFLLSGHSLMAIMILVNHRETRRRYGQTITVDPERIIYDDGVNRIESVWTDVVSIYSLPVGKFLGGYRHVVETPNGIFDYTGHIENVRLFRRIVGLYGAKAVEAGRRDRPDEDDLLKGRASLRTGEQVFHYRNRNARALLIVPVAFALTLCLLVWIQRQDWYAMPANRSPLPLWSPLTLGIPTLYLWWRYRVAQIRVDAFGITHIGPFGTQTLPWSDVQRYYRGDNDGMFYTVVGSRRKLRFSIAITGLETLKSEIAARATQSRNRGWSESGEDKS